jgi:hypothetical protein
MYKDEKLVRDTLDGMCAYYGDLMLIHGNDGGACGHAHRWAGESRVVHAALPGLWGVNTDPGHERRTLAMLALKPDVCVVFGDDRFGIGAAARAAGVDTYEFP